MKIFLKKNILSVLLIFFPITIALEHAHAPAPWIFVLACLSILPLAAWMGKATEHLSERAGTAIGGFLNATFGNAAELILAMIALKAGYVDIVKASITGSIIGNVLLVMGLSIFLGGCKYETQRFNRTAAGLGATLLALSVAALLVPALFHRVAEKQIAAGALTLAQESVLERGLSLEIAGVLFLVYVLHLVFSLKTHKAFFSGEGHATEGLGEPVWSVKKALGILLAATAGVAWVSEMLIGAVEATAKIWGLSEVFIGVIVVAVVGNAAEHSTAVLMALKNKMDLAIQIAIGSSIQVALLVAPLLVFLGFLFNQPMNLLFTDFEVLAVVMTVALTALVSADGESHWMEGVLLLALYAILGLAFYHLPA